MRATCEEASQYFIGFKKNEYIDVILKAEGQLFSFDNGFDSYVHERDEDQMLNHLIEFIIIDAVIQKRSFIKGYFYGYDDEGAIHRILFAIMEKLKFDVTDLNPGFRVDKNLTSALSPLEQYIKKLGIKELTVEKIHFGRLPNKSYYFIGVNVEGAVYRYELRANCGNIIVTANIDKGREQKKVAIEVSYIHTKKDDVFQKLLESICFDCIHDFIPGDVRTVECTIDNTIVEMVKPGFDFFKPNHVDYGNSQYFKFDF
ncbi:hypothetical protein A3860_17310 [Niastella vici]|uniref:Uncharacterized protein n=2 Tax=Niastella vici TaxID=1703345 RepID=A0A1V9G4E0_9BACT|nr:hypothetical protein A3860_17310 [Niastella vici]